MEIEEPKMIVWSKEESSKLGHFVIVVVITLRMVGFERRFGHQKGCFQSCEVRTFLVIHFENKIKFELC